MPTYKHPCPTCGNFIERDAKRCPYCATIDPFVPGRCPNCRAPIEDPRWLACPKCGSALREGIAPMPVPTVPSTPGYGPGAAATLGQPAQGQPAQGQPAQGQAAPGATYPAGTRPAAPGAIPGWGSPIPQPALPPNPPPPLAPAQPMGPPPTAPDAATPQPPAPPAPPVANPAAYACSGCGSALSPGARFCAVCGTLAG
jgi:hypothetical protein